MDEILERLFIPIGRNDSPYSWPVKLNYRMRNSDVVFLAHVLYDEYTQRKTMYISSKIQSTFRDSQTNCFLQIAPWFQGPAEISVRGLWINGGKNFLALQITGCSEPQGIPISFSRQNKNDPINKADSETSPTAWQGSPETNKNKIQSIIDLTSNEAPDHRSPSIEIEDEKFKILGTPRSVIKERKEYGEYTSGKHHGYDDSSAYGTGENFSSGKK